MDRRKLVRHILEQDCTLLREGARHSIFFNPSTKKTSTIPRHSEIDRFLARKICRDLGIKEPEEI